MMMIGTESGKLHKPLNLNSAGARAVTTRCICSQDTLPLSHMLPTCTDERLSTRKNPARKAGSSSGEPAWIHAVAEHSAPQVEQKYSFYATNTCKLQSTGHAVSREQNR